MHFTQFTLMESFCIVSQSNLAIWSEFETESLYEPDFKELITEIAVTKEECALNQGYNSERNIFLEMYF